MDKEAFVFSQDFSITDSSSCSHGRYVDHIDDPVSFSYSLFFKRYLLPNRPCVFSAKFTNDWGSRKRWVTQDGRPNFDHLLKKFGKTIVPVANCDVKEYNSNPKERIPLAEYICYWREYIQNNYCSSKGCLYLKDWHMYREFPEQDDYKTPVFFTSDWLNEYWDAIAVDDYRFVYMGPKGSWTPFHADVFRSYSWSANVCGRKKWLLFPPGQEEYLRDCNGNLPYDVTSPDLQDSSIYPSFRQSVQPIEVIQEDGEMIFVPSGWHHQVYNLEDTISINHNWVNGCNVSIMWHFLQVELEAVEQEIIEWKETMDDWHLHCQIIMKSCTGIDYKEFYTFLKTIAENRIQVLQNPLKNKGEAFPLISSEPASSNLGPYHAVFDLQRVVDVIAALLTNLDFRKLGIESFSPPPAELLNHLKGVLSSVK
ncbi:2-oxoglutarate and iron-dependent oxygenase JMJD4 [Ambystoma mexicanum]|uniref:2-oxoglutarate and iron-dependent oxygenase JMJD4 n=1 Tax=Ambystoma mexicanum TaxID=8296 RepID=UPI0037E9995C